MEVGDRGKVVERGMERAKIGIANARVKSIDPLTRRPAVLGGAGRSRRGFEEGVRL